MTSRSQATTEIPAARHSTWLLAALSLIAAVVIGLAGSGASAGQVLLDPTFDDCSADGFWVVNPQDAALDCSGSGAVLSWPTQFTMSQSGLAEPSAEYAAQVTLQVVGEANVTLTLDISGQVNKFDTKTALNETVTLNVTATAPAGAPYFVYMVTVQPNGSASVTVTNPSLMEALAPTQTPANTPTATQSPATAVPPPTTVPTLAATSTASPAGSPTAVGTATAKATAPTSIATVPVTAVPPGTTTTATPASQAPPSGQGAATPQSARGLLINGSFDSTTAKGPTGWTKYGGVLTASSSPGRGGIARFDSSTASTKWVYQTVPVTSGHWYEGSAWARIFTGKAESLIRVSWYASSDGSGRALSNADGSATDSNNWTALAIGPVQAPDSAKSARFRLMLRPAGNPTVLFDDAYFGVSQEPVATATPTPQPAAMTPTMTRGSATPDTSETVGDSTATAAPTTEGRRPTTLRLSEVLPNPVEPGNDAAYEWVELVNVGPEPVDLSGWYISDREASDMIPQAVVRPGGYLIVAGASASVPNGVQVIRVEDGRIGNGLNNLSETITLTSPDGSNVDEVSFGSDGALPAPDAGKTIGVPGTPNDDGLGNVWMLTLQVTPGFPNLFAAPPTVSPSETSTQTAPDLDHSADAQGVDVKPGQPPPPVTEPGNRSIIPWFILIAAVGAGAGGFAVRRGPALVSLKDRITRRG